MGRPQDKIMLDHGSPAWWKNQLALHRRDEKSVTRYGSYWDTQLLQERRKAGSYVKEHRSEVGVIW